MNEERSEFGPAARFANCVEAQMVSGVIPWNINDYTTSWNCWSGRKNLDVFSSRATQPISAIKVTSDV